MITTQRELNTIIYRMLNEKLKNKAKPSYEVLEQQLQAYKEKEYKLREYIRSYYFEDNFLSIGVMKCCRNEIEEILNEGDK